MSKSIVKQVLKLESKTMSELRKIHSNLFMENPSSLLSKEYLIRKLAYRIQELSIGGLDAKSKAKLSEIASGGVKAKQASLLVGTKIRREYNNIIHEVEAMADGFEYNGQKWSSLSAIATKITGSKWNGQKFFGFRNK